MTEDFDGEAEWFLIFAAPCPQSNLIQAIGWSINDA
jgi:hypothetical protein